MDRTALLNEIYAARTRLEGDLAGLTPEQMTAPDLPGDWSVKDLLAHLGWWEQRACELYADLAQGREPEHPVDDAQLDALNARLLEPFHAQDLDSVRDFERKAYRRLLRLVETAPEENLFDAQRFAWLRGEPFVEWVRGNSSGHYAEHFPMLEQKLAEVSSTADVAQRRHPLVRRAGEFLEHEGRDIDRALYDFAFGTLPAAAVLDVLARYQNADGGFTRLEFDIEAPVSNPFAADLALVILNWVAAPVDHPLVTRLVEHLESTQQADGTWRFTPEVYQHTLAPWFQQWAWPNLSPSGQIAGQLKALGLGSNRLHTRVQNLFAWKADPADLTGDEYYTIPPYAAYLQTEWDFPQADFYRWGTVWWLVRQSLRQPGIDASHFFDLIRQPASAVARRLPADLLQTRLDQLQADQQPDGGWPTPYAAHWRKWTTITNLLVLRAYGKV